MKLEMEELALEAELGIPDEAKQWLAIRKEAGLKIDPETAHVTFGWADGLDPYGVGNLEPEYRGLSIGREYFARSPGSDIWVLFDDLSDATQKALWERRERHKETWPTSEARLTSILPRLPAEAVSWINGLSSGSRALLEATLQYVGAENFVRHWETLRDVYQKIDSLQGMAGKGL
jgi:hypothetical protein